MASRLRRAHRAAALLAVVAMLAAYSYVDPVLKLGWRQIVMSVENESALPARLLVAEDGERMGAAVGTATPGIVRPLTTMDVTFGLPSESGWAIFVKAGPRNGPLFAESDTPDATGRAPFTITINAQGDPSARSEGLPWGWMGQP